ncbi:MAG: hypothetical protein GX367_02080 [Bacteroidales bacterium]|nr:hypothetical protein [Bacteroidales bacterium]
MEKGNKYDHGQRVANLSKMIRKNILPDDNTRDDILIVSAWFHDYMHSLEQRKPVSC